MEYRRRSSSGGRNSAELGFRCSSVSPQVRCRQNLRILNYNNIDNNVEKAASKCQMCGRGKSQRRLFLL